MKIVLLVLFSVVFKQINQALCKMGTDPKIVLAEIDDHHIGKTFLNAI